LRTNASRSRNKKKKKKRDSGDVRLCQQHLSRNDGGQKDKKRPKKEKRTVN